MMKTYLKIYIPAIAIVFIISALPVFAAIFRTDYFPLVPDAFGPGGAPNPTANLGGFLAQVFNWGIAIAVVLALVMIIWGGIEYMTTDSWNKKDEGKTRIREALKGLGLALVSYLILYTINPTLVNFSGNTFLAPATGGTKGATVNPPGATNPNKGGASQVSPAYPVNQSKTYIQPSVSTGGSSQPSAAQVGTNSVLAPAAANSGSTFNPTAGIPGTNTNK